jgi:hypothetical protein
MPASRRSKKIMAIRRDQARSPRDVFLAEVRDSLPRVSLDSDTAWEAGRQSIERSMAADELLRSHGYDRDGRPVSRRAA